MIDVILLIVAIAWIVSIFLIGLTDIKYKAIYFAIITVILTITITYKIDKKKH